MKGTKTRSVTDAFYGCERQENLFELFIHIVKIMVYLQQLKRDAAFKIRYVKGVPFVTRGYTKGVPFLSKQRVKGWSLGQSLFGEYPPPPPLWVTVTLV